MLMVATGRMIEVTTKAHKAFNVRMSPSYRVLRSIRTHKFGEPEQRAIKTAEAVANRLEQIEEQGHFTDYDINQTIIPEALWFAELPPVKVKDEVVFKRALILEQ